MRRAAKVDANQGDIVSALRKGWHVCAQCRADFHSYSKTRKYCSHACYVEHDKNEIRARGLIGASRPKSARSEPALGHHCKCKVCGSDFRSKSKTQYCHDHKLQARAAQGGKGAKRANTTKLTSVCAQCGANFEHFPSVARKFCSYQCHLDSGGALRAGKASGTMTRKYGAKKDANHAEIVGAFKKLGAAILDLSTMGSGIPDLLVWCQAGWHLVDVKNPKTGYGRRGLNPIQKEWANNWKGGPVYLISTIDQAVDLVNGRFDGLKRFPE